jgi:hypothetical protein
VLASSPRSSAPSVRFWDSRRNNLGAVLALVAGFITIRVNVWPMIPASGRGDVTPIWRLIGFPIGGVYLASFLLADRRWSLARLLLTAAALAQILAAFTLGRSYEAMAGLSGQIIGVTDLLPAIMALVAAFCISRPPVSTGQQAGRPEEAP